MSIYRIDGETLEVNASQTLKEMKKLRSRYTAADTSRAVECAGKFAKECQKPFYVYGGNSYMCFVWNVTEYLNDILGFQNSSGKAYKVTPELDVYKLTLINTCREGK